jgi:hypothetical protein
MKLTTFAPVLLLAFACGSESPDVSAPDTTTSPDVVEQAPEQVTPEPVTPATDVPVAAVTAPEPTFMDRCLAAGPLPVTDTKIGQCRAMEIYAVKADQHDEFMADCMDGLSPDMSKTDAVATCQVLYLQWWPLL